VRRWFVMLLLASLALATATYSWLNHPLGPATNTPLDLSIEAGSSARTVAQLVHDAGLPVHPTMLFWCFRLSGKARLIKAGSYEIETDISPWGVVQKLVRGEEALRSVTLVEGWTFSQVRAALSGADALRHDTLGQSDEALMDALGAPGLHPEGRFFPDTYTYAKGSSDLALLKRARRALDKRLTAAWSLRGNDSPLQTPDQVLTLASIIEKETGRDSDRPLVAAVFVNRLRIGMPLQTDPTVIYGMGDRFDGNLRKRDLLRDTPYNTYTRGGLPPTPIAMPGRASLLAAVQPAPDKLLYFVARGDGSGRHVFSADYASHNKAVDAYIQAVRNRQPAP